MKSFFKVLPFFLFSVFNCNGQNNGKVTVPQNAEDISPLLVGETVPNAALQDSKGNQINLKEYLSKQPTVLVFYRGGWCPYCSTHLSSLADIEQDILGLGYQIIAISPDNYQNLKSTENKNNINYTILSDPQGKFIQDIGIAFETPTMLKGFIATKGQKGDTSQVMPVPTVMVLDKDGIILFEYINPNYKERISGAMLLAVLKTIK